MNNRLLITGGVLRPNGFELGEGKYYGCAKLLRLDLASGRVEELLSIDQGNENFPETDPNLEFTASAVEGNRLWLTTDTEVRLYEYPTLALKATYSHPCFHNIHSVAIRGDELYVTSTGLDMVVVLNKHDGTIVEQINAECKPTWHRFSATEDYRKHHSTRPHDCHPNFVFWVDDEPWVTRCTQEDAVCLRNFDKRIDVSGTRRPISIHDGITLGNHVLFTLVDGSLVIVDPRSRSIGELIDLSALPGFGGVRGWCRGLYVNGDIAYVGFSRLRPTKRMEKIAWVKRLLMQGGMVEESSVLAIDLKRREIVADHRIASGQIDAIYSVLPEPVERS